MVSLSDPLPQFLIRYRPNIPVLVIGQFWPDNGHHPVLVRAVLGPRTSMCGYLSVLIVGPNGPKMDTYSLLGQNVLITRPVSIIGPRPRPDTVTLLYFFLPFPSFKVVLELCISVESFENSFF